MARYLVLKTLPKGQNPGDTVELNEDEASVFMMPGIEAVRPIEDDATRPTGRRGYRRRDVQAEA